MSQGVLVLADVVLATGIEDSAESFRHVVESLALVDNIVWIDDSRNAVQLAILLANLPLNDLSIFEHLLLVLRLRVIEINLNFTPLIYLF